MLKFCFNLKYAYGVQFDAITKFVFGYRRYRYLSVYKKSLSRTFYKGFVYSNTWTVFDNLQY